MRAKFRTVASMFWRATRGAALAIEARSGTALKMAFFMVVEEEGAEANDRWNGRGC